MGFKFEVAENNIDQVESAMIAVSDIVEQIQDKLEAYENLDKEDESDEAEEEKESIFVAIQEGLAELTAYINERFTDDDA